LRNPPCAQLLWCEFHVMKDLQERKKEKTTYRACRAPLAWSRAARVFTFTWRLYAVFGAATHPGVGGGTHRRRAIVAPPLSVVKCLWEVFVWRSCRARVCAGVGGVFSVGVSCVRVTC